MYETEKKQIEEIVRIHEKYRNSFFWSSKGTSANQRRNQEFDNEYNFEIEGNKYYIRQRLEISCANYYYSLRVERNGRKTNITVLKTLLRKI